MAHENNLEKSPYTLIGHNCPVFLIKDTETKLMLDCGSGSHSYICQPLQMKFLKIY